MRMLRSWKKRGRCEVDQEILDPISNYPGGFYRRSPASARRVTDGTLFVVVDDQPIHLEADPQNIKLAGIFFSACGVSTLGLAAKVAIQRLQVMVDRRGDHVSTYRSFSAVVDGHTILVPEKSGRVLSISKEETCSLQPNGSFGVWLEHPEGDGLEFNANVDVKTALAEFKDLCVDTQACSENAMQWLVAMHEGLFPYVRDLCVTRPILEHVGPTQQGKTSGAQRFTLLHGLGQVKGDYSVAALGNSGDLGLLVMDNKEQANFEQPLVDYCLSLATGAERGRSTQDGKMRRYLYRPVGVITSIEGVPKAELKARVIEVPYKLKGEATGRSEIENKISAQRNEIRSAFMFVFQRYLQIREEKRQTPNPIPNFEEWFREICNLLRAYADVAGLPEGWADSIVAKWGETLAKVEEPKVDELDHHIEALFLDTKVFSSHSVTHEGKKGTLHRTTVSALLHELQRTKVASVPKDKTGMARRLRAATFEAFTFLDDKSGLEPLKRKAFKRWVGFFVPEET